jgi:hypothetical protein
VNPLFRSTFPVEIQEQAAKQYELILENPFHPPLRLKQIDVFWPVRINGSYRALGGLRRAPHEAATSLPGSGSVRTINTSEF